MRLTKIVAILGNTVFLLSLWGGTSWGLPEKMSDELFLDHQWISRLVDQGFFLSILQEADRENLCHDQTADFSQSFFDDNDM